MTEKHLRKVRTISKKLLSEKYPDGIGFLFDLETFIKSGEVSVLFDEQNQKLEDFIEQKTELFFNSLSEQKKEISRITKNIFLTKFPQQESFLYRINTISTSEESFAYYNSQDDSDLDAMIKQKVLSCWGQITNEDAKIPVEVTSYFLPKYPTKAYFLDEIISSVKLNWANYYYEKKYHEFGSFIIRSTKQAWSDIFKREYKIHIIGHNEDGVRTIKKTRHNLFDDLTKPEQKAQIEDEEKIKADQYEEGIIQENPSGNQETGMNETKAGDSELEFSLIDNDEIFSTSGDEKTENTNNKLDKYLVAFGKLQMTLDETPDDKLPLIKRYFKSVPSLSMVSLNTKKLTDSDLINNISYYKFKTWLDKDNTRIYQELALQQMMIQVSRMDELYENYSISARNNGKEVKGREKFPFVGAVLVSADGKVIANSYKGCTSDGYEGSLAEHCEYLLFEKVLGKKNMHYANASTLFVTLEPCTIRGFPKLPCVVRCLESGISNIYIGTFDPNPDIAWKGIRFLKNGYYEFEKNSPFYTHENGRALQRYFQSKRYREEQTSKTHTFFVSEGINVFTFCPDISLEIIRRNEKFVKYCNYFLY